MKAINIEWDIDIDDAIQELNDKPIEEAAQILNTPKDKYTRMNTTERENYAYDLLRKSPYTLKKIMGLPNEVTIPESMENDTDEEITDWLSYEYEYCIKSYELVYDTEERYVLKIEGDYYAGPNQKYPDMFNIAGNGPLGAKLLNYNEGIKLRKKYLKNGFEYVELEIYDAKTYLERTLQAILILEEERKKGKDPGYAIQNNAKKALEYLKQIDENK